MTNNDSDALFACVNCHQRYKFDDLSSGDMICKECRARYPKVKCIYCTNEFKQSSTNITSICEKCDQFVKSYGKPTSCDYCNVLAAFIGNRCQMCTNSEKRWGPPIECTQCRRVCAFNRIQESLSYTLCYLCTKNCQRAKLKSRLRLNSSLGENFAKKRLQNTRQQHPMNEFSLQPAEKKTRWMSSTSNSIVLSLQKEKRNKETNKDLSQPVDSHANKDNMAEITRLKDNILKLQQQLMSKDQIILEKEKMITTLKAETFELNKTMRTRIGVASKDLTDSNEYLKEQNRNLMKQLSTKKK